MVKKKHPNTKAAIGVIVLILTATVVVILYQANVLSIQQNFTSTMYAYDDYTLNYNANDWNMGTTAILSFVGPIGEYEKVGWLGPLISGPQGIGDYWHKYETIVKFDFMNGMPAEIGAENVQIQSARLKLTFKSETHTNNVPDKVTIWYFGASALNYLGTVGIADARSNVDVDVTNIVKFAQTCKGKASSMLFFYITPNWGQVDTPYAGWPDSLADQTDIIEYFDKEDSDVAKRPQLEITYTARLSYLHDVSVLVKDYDTSQPIDALIRLTNSVNEYEEHSTSGGIYTFSSIEAGAYTLKITKLGYVMKVLPITVGDQDLPVEVLLEKVTSAQRTLTVNVYDTDGVTLVSGVSVSCAAGVKTTSAGVVAFTVMSNTTYTLTASYMGRTASLTVVMMNDDKSVYMIMGQGPVSPPENKVLLYGRITDKTTGGSLSGAVVYITGEGYDNSYKTGSTGYFEFRVSKLKTYSLQFVKDGYETYSADASVGTASFEASIALVQKQIIPGMSDTIVYAIIGVSIFVLALIATFWVAVLRTKSVKA